MHNRRELFKLIGALGAAEGLAPLGAQETPQRVTKEMVAATLNMLGLEFSEEHQAMLLPNANRMRGQLETLRKIEVPLDTDPAFRFLPRFPPATVPKGPVRFRPQRATPPASWKSVDELAFAPVTQLAELIRRRKVSSTELTKMYLARLTKHSPVLLCVITLTEELALQQAAQADRDIRRRYRGPLHGIPWGAKDLFATKGIPTTWGAEPFKDQMIPYDATVVERLRDAGAVLVAKLSMGALAQGGLWFGGMTKTPWNTEQSSSGSSAGSASATAAGLVGFALGTETLGSIITPSTRCGTVGLRPTYGRVSRYGAMGLSWTMDKVGPICRTVEDCALVLRAIHGPDGHDLTVIDAPLEWDPRRPLAKMRIGFLEKAFESVQGEEKKLYTGALDALKKAGADLKSAALPAFDTGALLLILTAEAATAFDDLTRSGGVNQLRGQNRGDWPNTFRAARLIPAIEYLRAQRARTLLMQEMEKFMSNWDVLVSPPGASLSVTNLTGHPQVVVPCGFVNAMPRGLLFTGKLYGEGAALRVAMAYERATGWHKSKPPGFAV